MAESSPLRNNSVFSALMAATVALYFGFALFAGWVILQYGLKTADFGWQIQRIGDALYVVSIEERGPAWGSLEPGDKIVAINNTPVTSETELGIELKSVVGTGLYVLQVQRAGNEREVWLRSRTLAGFSFFEFRLPLLGTSVIVFFCGMAMLLRWNSMAARFGFLASAVTALRLGAWAIQPLSIYFDEKEFLPLFLFCLPAGLAIPLTIQSFLHLGEPAQTPRGWSGMGWVLTVVWFGIVLTGAPLGSIPLPVPEGLAFLSYNRVEYRASLPLLQYGIPLYVLVGLGASGWWLRYLHARTTAREMRSRLAWLQAAGVFFAIPAALFEISEWLGVHSGVTGWNLLMALLALTYQRVITADQMTRPSLTVRAFLGAMLPEKMFQKLDSRYFPSEASCEQRLRNIVSELDSCSQLGRLDRILTKGLEEAVGADNLDLEEEHEAPETLPLAPKRNGEAYTQRERHLIQHAVSHFFVSQKRLRKRIEEREELRNDGVLNLMRECPQCGFCYDSNVVRCPNDLEVPVLRLPIERTVDGKYILDRLIGRGGMGAVYVARDQRLNRRVAIKVMLSELFGQEVALQRFEREAQLAARVSHPNIIQIYDFGAIGAMGAYLVMEYVEGRTMREELANEEPIPAVLCLNWFQQLLDGIEAAHSHGIVHRDLKPENLLLEDSGQGRMNLKILDFGLAKMQLLNLSKEENLSLGVNTIGTVGYVPPEQLTGASTDARSDIYAIGRIVSEAVCGVLPEAGAEVLPEPLARVVTKCTAMRKEDRYEDVAALRPELIASLCALQLAQPVTSESAT